MPKSIAISFGDLDINKLNELENKKISIFYEMSKISPTIRNVLLISKYPFVHKVFIELTNGLTKEDLEAEDLEIGENVVFTKISDILDNPNSKELDYDSLNSHFEELKNIKTYSEDFLINHLSFKEGLVKKVFKQKRKF